MKKLAIFFPGIGYHCDKPLLYYARKLTQECGYEESISLSYSYDGRNIRGDEQKMQQAFEALYAQAEQQLSKVDFGKYSEILFVSKSVGTIIASNYAWKYKIPCQQVLYTPLKQTYAFPHENAIAFIGRKIRGAIRKRWYGFQSSRKYQFMYMKKQITQSKHRIP